MKNEVKLKEAIKVALAFALVYGIALRINWMLPSWAGWSVVAVAASSSGQSIEKGAMRLLGTLLACLSAVIIIALSPQDRWPFVILTTVWLFFTSYMMLADKSRSYFWFCVSYVCLVILSVGSSSVGAFAIAMYRTLETALGIIVYTLIAVFVWPKSNIGMIKKTSIAVVQSQMDLFQYAYQEMMGTIDKTNLFQLREVEMKQLTALNQALKDEASENYEIAEVRGLWDEFLMRNQHLQKTKNRLFAAIDDLKHLEIKPNISNLEPFFQEINARFSEVSGILAGSKPAFKIQNINFGYDNQDININKFSHLDKSALAILLSELKKVEEESK